MTFLTHGTSLPDPVIDARFYDGVPLKRGLAWVVDIVLVTILTFLAGLFTLSLLWWVWPVTYLAIGFLYRVGTLAGGSATLGMRLFGIELRDAGCRRLDGMQALLHVGGYYATMAFVLPAVASAGAILATPRRQGLTDLLLGTTAINRPGD
jgi:uncharacterized RDD family membrane protein YckC